MPIEYNAQFSGRNEEMYYNGQMSFLLLTNFLNCFSSNPLGTSYKFRVRALNILGESEPSAASKPYVVSGYSNRAYERPVTGPYITFTDAINETTIMLKWMVSVRQKMYNWCAKIWLFFKTAVDFI